MPQSSFLERSAGRKRADHLFAESRKPAGRQLRKNIRTWVSKCPPIGSLIL